MIVCNIFKKVFKNYLEKIIISWTVKGLFGQFYGHFKNLPGKSFSLELNNKN